jgi:hypothetical protein
VDVDGKFPEPSVEESFVHHMTMLDEFKHMAIKRAKSASPSLKNATALSARKNSCWASSETTVRATKEEVLAYVWNFDAKSRCAVVRR